MKVLGLVLELNPAHFGHKYFIEQAKDKVNPDYTICVLSTSFCQRGLVSVADKWKKAQIALKLGVDFVFELPVTNYLQSADAFCRGSIEKLVNLKVTDIAFGVELDNLEKLQKIVDIMDSDAYNLDLKENLAKGSSYASSSLKAIMKQTNDEEIIKSVSEPNNILAIGYLKALKNYPNINIHLIKRINNNYNDLDLSSTSISSATAIRKAITDNTNYLDQVIDKDYKYLDENVLLDKLFDLIKYQFALHDLSYFKDIQCIDEGIEVRINKFLGEAKSFNELASLVRTKRYSLNHVSRALVNIALDNKKIENELYLRLLAFKANKKDYLNKLSKDIKKQIFSSPVNSSSKLLEAELKASKIYDLITGLNIYKQEFSAPIKIEDENE